MPFPGPGGTYDVTNSNPPLSTPAGSDTAGPHSVESDRPPAGDQCRTVRVSLENRINNERPLSNEKRQGRCRAVRVANDTARLARFPPPPDGCMKCWIERNPFITVCKYCSKQQKGSFCQFPTPGNVAVHAV